MSGQWAVVLLTGAATFALKAAGPLLLGARALPAAVSLVVALLGPTLLAALIVVQVFADGQRLVVDARAAGLAVAALLIAARASTLVIVLAAAATAALFRYLTGG